jgi:BirA family biotin operon repressor/biotin-[acetyl-CoA-carboxylase] ligase
VKFDSIQKIEFGQIDSTNTFAKLHIEEFDQSALTVIIAEKQTGGRGQFARQWISPPGGLYVSYVYFIDRYPSNPGEIGQLACRAVIELLGELGITGVKKEPNDVLVNGKKIGGILCETIQLHRGEVEASMKIGVIIGIGLNIALPEELLSSIDQPATSILACGCPISPGEAEQILRQKLIALL